MLDDNLIFYVAKISLDTSGSKTSKSDPFSDDEETTNSE